MKNRQKSKTLAISVAVAVLMLGFAVQSSAVPVFTDWTSFTTSSSSGAGDGTATGTLTIAGVTTNVSFAGDVRSDSSTNDDRATFSGSLFTPSLALSDEIRSDSGIGNTHTITFDKAVVDPVLHIASLGRTFAPSFDVDWTFADPFTIVSGNAGFTNPSGNVLNGLEGNGTISFSGEFTQISWTTNEFESFSLFQVGAESVVPEPSTFALLGLGLGALGMGYRRKKNS